jgi:hypothetical protein
MNKTPSSIVTLMLHTPALPSLPEGIRQLVTVAYAARGGAERMSLAEWRDVEQELNRRFENEHQERQR